MPEPTATCSIEGCEAPPAGRGMCSVHYGRWHRQNPGATAGIRRRLSGSEAPPISPIDAAWLAGLIEGEGCIATYNNGAHCLIVNMTDEDVIRRVFSVAGVGKVTGPLPQSRFATVPGKKPIWRWRTARALDVLHVLTAVAPQLGSRRRARAMEVIEDIESRIASTGRAS